MGEPIQAGTGEGLRRSGCDAGQPLLAACLQSIADGETSALEALYDATADLVFSLARRILGDAREAEEAVLDVFRYVWERAARYDVQRGSVHAWLMTITRGRSLDRQRAARSRGKREREVADTLSETLGLADPGGGPEQVMLTAERDDALHRALRSLGEEERRAVDLAFFRGLSHEEVASELGQPLGTVKSRIRRALIKLHRLLRALEADE